MSQGTTPELRLAEQWDRVIDVGLRRLAYGMTAGGVMALVLFRGSHARTAITAFGAGAGLGSAWQQTSKEVKIQAHNRHCLVHQFHLAHARMQFEDLVPSLLRSK